MPTYPLTFPTNVAPENVRVRPVWAVVRFDNPVDLTAQLQLRNVVRFDIDVQLQPMGRAHAQLWTQFFYDLRGGFGTFQLNLTPHCPGLSPAPGVRTFRLANNDAGWDSRRAVLFGFAFTAIEVL